MADQHDRSRSQRVTGGGRQGAPGGRQGPSGGFVAGAISAPYNFVPLADTVHTPAWSREVSHDWPFADGFSGAIHYTLHADSPLLVGGQQIKPDAQRPGEVKPFRLPDGRFAIPGSSLKGMLRAVVEIAGFGRMRMVDAVRPGLRDISGKYVSASYAARVRDRVRTGFLRRRDDGGLEIVPCAMVRLNHRDLERELGVPAPIFAKRTSVKDKYERWQKLCSEQRRDPRELAFKPGSPDAQDLFRGDRHGVPVFTGQISDSTARNGKFRDFLFHSPRPNEAIEVNESPWRDFLLIHGDGNRNDQGPWQGYWKPQFRKGAQVPVFYLQDGELLRIGLAYMPKLAGDFTTHDCIAHSSERHLQPPGAVHGYDLADLLFGAINGDAQTDALRGRVSCETAVAIDTPDTVAQPATILNGPKPTFFPNYLTQDSTPDTCKLRGAQYATYLRTKASPAPTLRGYKRYPARPRKDVKVQALTREQQGNKRVQVNLHVLPEGTQFSGRIVFHNLRREELGALLWALTWADDGHLRHGLGMGKPFGFGQIHVDVDSTRSIAEPNDPKLPEVALDAEARRGFVEAFEAHMGRHIPNWAQSPQIINLRTMADPNAATRLGEIELRHMRLDAKERINEFSDAKKAGLVLADYAVVTGRMTKAPSRTVEDRTIHPRAHSAAPPPVQKALPVVETERWEQCTLEWNPGTSSLKGHHSGGKIAFAGADQARTLLDQLSSDQRKRLIDKRSLKGMTVEVEKCGNRYALKAIISA